MARPEAGPESGGAGGSGGGGGGDTVTYTDQIAPLLANNCTRCHSGANPSSGIDLSSYESVKSRATRANTAIQSGKMPPGNPLSAANKALFQSWVDQGTPE